MFTSIKTHVSRLGQGMGIHRDSLVFGLLAIVAFVGPFFFFPAYGFSVMASKGFMVIGAAILILLATGVSVLKRGSASRPRHWVFGVLGILLVVELIGAIFAPSFLMSFVGYGFETNTWAFLAAFAILAIASYRSIKSFSRAGMIFGGILAGFLVLFLVHIIRFAAGGTFLNLGVLGSSVSSLVGSWTDWAALLGFVTLFVGLTLEIGGLRKGINWFLGVIGTLALAALLFIDNRTVWVIIGALSLVGALYVFALAFWDHGEKKYRKQRAVPWYLLCIVIVSIAGLFFGPALNTLASRHQPLVSNDVRLSVSSTARAFVGSISHNPATGFGPNGFSTAWNMSKPPAVAATVYGGTSFSLGSGFVPTQIAQNGIVGAIGWIALFVLLAIAIIRTLTRGFDSSADRYFAVMLAGSVLYLSVVAWVLLPGAYLLALLAILIGAMLGIESVRTGKTETEKSFIDDPRASFFGILAVTVLILITIFAGYIEVRKIAGAVHSVRGSNAESAGNVDLAISQFSLASAYAHHDVYYRELSALIMAKASQTLSSANTASKDQATKQAQQILGSALAAAQAAVSANPGDYQNYLALGNVYRTFVTLGVSDAAAQAKSAYDMAKKRDPRDSSIYLAYAQLAAAQGDTAGALDSIAQSINYYPTTGAYILRAQIQAAGQNWNDAITSMKAALTLDPYNAQTAYQLGLLFYHQADYADAILAFKTAISNNRSYGIAYVYLGVAYEKSGDMTDANAVYDYVRKQSPDNADSLISQVRSAGAAQAPIAPADAVSAPATTPAKTPAKPVAPAAKKK